VTNASSLRLASVPSVLVPMSFHSPLLPSVIAVAVGMPLVLYGVLRAGFLYR
jgi:hypothetical protein